MGVFWKTYLQILPLHTSHPQFSRAVAKDEAHQGIFYYQALVSYKVTEEDDVMGQEAAPGVGPEEYMETDYEFGETVEVMEEDGDTNEVPNEPPTSEVRQDHPAPPRDPINGTRSLEEEVANLRQRLLAEEARAVQVEHKRDKVVREMT